ncbi:MAG: hypothetical protein HYX35_00390 [Proteobacteria bacterium]|nr:hypothetical protein [Pseudomonadota bacterium]
MKNTHFYFLILYFLLCFPTYAAEGSESSSSLSSTGSLDTSISSTFRQELDKYMILLPVLGPSVPSPLSPPGRPVPSPILPPEVPASIAGLPSRHSKSRILQEEVEVSLYSVSPSMNLESYEFGTEELFQPPSSMASYDFDTEGLFQPPSSMSSRSQSRISCFKRCWKGCMRRRNQEEPDPELP